MSDEHFLSRWSRRKREAIEENAEPASQPEGEAPAAPAEVREASQAARPVPPAQSDVPVFDPASLPSIESITAETDIRAFLAPGVPAETARAALRRAWSADPAIRDFVGLAEYAWDFTKPDSMPGFGPLQMTDELRRYAAQILGNTEPESVEPPPASAAPPGAPAEETSAAVENEPAPALDSSAESGDADQGRANVMVENSSAAPQHERDVPPVSKRGHGSALPE